MRLVRFFLSFFFGVLYQEVRDAYKVYKAPSSPTSIVASSASFRRTTWVRADCENKYGCKYLTIIDKASQKQYVLNVDEGSISDKQLAQVKAGATVSFERISPIYTKTSGAYYSFEALAINGAGLAIDGEEVVPKFGYSVSLLVWHLVFKTGLLVLLLIFLILTNKNAYQIKANSKKIGWDQAIRENKFWRKRRLS